MDIDFEIKPYIGVANLEFGMKKDAVENAIGQPDQTTKNHLNQRVEFRSFMNVAYSADGDESLIHIGFGRQEENVRYKDMFLFKEDASNVLNFLIKEDGNPYLYLGFIIFLELGITLTGFHDNDISQKAVTVFPRGAWDKRLSKMKKFVNPKTH